VSTYRGITVNGNRAYQSARTLQLETTTNGIGSDPGITALIVEGDESMHLTISLRDARELAGWLIEHAVDPQAAPDDDSETALGRRCDAMDPHEAHRWSVAPDGLVMPGQYDCPGHG